jgi:glycerate kinase
VRLLAAPDKFRGTLDATAAASAIALAARHAAWDATERPVSDGGEGFAAVLGGEQVTCTVSGPLGTPVHASFNLRDGGKVAVIEMAAAAGRALLPSPTGDQPLEATTQGVGELIVVAARTGARQVIVGCGGSATTDGGRGAVDAITRSGIDLAAFDLIVATDVTTHFVDAARVFAPQKGASDEQVARLTTRLERCRIDYFEEHGVDVGLLERAGAAGGLAGGLAALGGSLVSGFDVVAAAGDLAAEARSAQLVVTGEGSLDATSLEGKAVAGVLALVPPATPVLVVAGVVEPGIAATMADRLERPISVRSLVECVGEDRSVHDTAAALSEVVANFVTPS